ncbi:ubiquitin-protein ligase E3A-like [Tubulanus polymorphus]|uniref:ubiquitin-protein ligase E3A-like n=1 Tax=Tubulanus polymorphus TaxID=672921 RepID=UPI003DA49C62
MSSNEDSSEGRGAGQGVDHFIPVEATASSSSSDEMKRTAAKQLIEKYYHQLIDGCGQDRCLNPYCRSSAQFRFKSDLDPNHAAIKALELLKEHAQLCDSKPPKVAKQVPTSSDTSAACSSSSSGATSSSGAASTSLSDSAIDINIKPAVKEIPYLDEEKVTEIIEDAKNCGSWSKLIRTLGMVYNNSDSLMKSFQKNAKKTENPSDEIKQESLASGEESDDASKNFKITKDESMELDACCDSMEKTEDDSAICLSSSSRGESMDSQDDDVDISQVDVIKPSSQTTTQSKQIQFTDINVDFDSLRRSYAKLFSIPDLPFNSALINALLYLSRSLEMDLKYHQMYERQPKMLEAFVIVMEIPELSSPEYLEDAFPAYCKAAGTLPMKAFAELARTWSTFGEERLRTMLQSLHQLITVRVLTGQWGLIQCLNDDHAITGATKLMKSVFYASLMAGTMDANSVIQAERELSLNVGNNLTDFFQGSPREPKERKETAEDPIEKILNVHAINCRKPLIAYEEFLNDPLNDQIEMDRDYTNYRSETDKFSFMTHSFILNTATKNLGMYFDHRIRMINERRWSMYQSHAAGAPMMPYLRLRIRRDHIIDDALVGLEMVASDNPQDLKKQLYVEFEGEQGIDEGGVQKEFFQLIVEEIFNPDIGMFTFSEELQQFWFNSTSYESDAQFTLIGIVLGLAIYNNVILDVHFPMVVYRKLLGKIGTFEDLKDSHPSLANGLQELLDYEGNVEETVMHNYRIGYQDVFGNNLTHDLKENGDEIPVTNENRQEFVDLYADFLLNKSIERQFGAFKRGFAMVTDESPIKMLFRPEEVELLVCGSKDFEFYDLENAAEYDGGFTADSQTIKDFWSVVHDFTDEQKRKLLQFTTGSDRVPVGGLSKLKLIISKNGPDSERLPTSHTCFNVLLLPSYASKDKLRERLLKAITYAKGFGML